MPGETKGRGVKLKPRTKRETMEEYADVIPPPPRDIYESVVLDFGFDPLKEMTTRPS